MPAPRATQAVIRNAIKAVQECGLPVGTVEVAKDGTVRILAQSKERSLWSGGEEPSCDEIFGVGSN